jgi:HEAT repeat protein
VSSLSSVPSLVWSSRENIRAQLLSLLHATPRNDTALRWQIVRQLRVFGSPESLPLLRNLLLDGGEYLPIRDEALAVGQRYGLHLSAPELTRLLAQEAALSCAGLSNSGWCFLSPRKLLSLVRSEDDDVCAAAEAALARMSTEKRVDILDDEDCGSLPPRLVEWLFARWYAEDRHHLSGTSAWGHDANLRVALAHRERPEAWKLLVEWARDRTTGDLELFLYWGLPSDARERLLESAPGLPELAARQLLLPPPALVACHGQEMLLRRLHRIVQARSVACRVSYGLMDGPPGFSRAVELLGEWREARPLLYRLLCDFDMAHDVRRELADCLFDQDRATAIRWAMVAARYPDNLELVRHILWQAASMPVPGDRALFLTALRGSDDVAHCFALEGLFTLGESGPGWCDRLTSLTHSSHPLVRLRAAACLVKEGRHEWRSHLRTTVLDAPEHWLRADAARWIRELDAEASRPVLLQALAAYVQLPPRRRVHEPIDVVLALSRLGTPEDLSALLDASLEGACTYLIAHELERHLARQEGRPFVEVTTSSWRIDVSAALAQALRVGRGT